MRERPVLDQLNIVVTDMEAMAGFYERLGVSFPVGPREWAAWEPHHRNSEPGEGLQVDLDSSAFASQWNAGWPAGRTGIVIGFRVSSRAAVDELCAELIEAGYACQQPPYDTFWGSRYAVVTDPDGNSVGLMSPRDPAMVSAPPAPPAPPSNSED